MKFTGYTIVIYDYLGWHMSEDYTNLRRIPRDEYQVKRNSDESLEILISSELSKILKISTEIEFKIQNEKIKNTNVIILRSNKIPEDKILYN